MPIQVIVLDEEKRCDQGKLSTHSNLSKPFDEKLSATQLSETWFPLIDAELFEGKSLTLTLFGAERTYRLASGRLNEKERAIFVTHTCRDGREFLIVVGYLFDHKHDTYPLLAGDTHSIANTVG